MKRDRDDRLIGEPMLVGPKGQQAPGSVPAVYRRYAGVPAPAFQRKAAHNTNHAPLFGVDLDASRNQPVGRGGAATNKTTRHTTRTHHGAADPRASWVEALGVDLDASGYGAQFGEKLSRVSLVGAHQADAVGRPDVAAASRGVQGPAVPFPHADRIERSLGRPIPATAHVDETAQSACSDIGAEAYTLGDRVAFASPNPSLHTAAHEAAHVFDQAQGVQPTGGVGVPGDRYEKAADQVADRVVAGQSAADLIAPAANRAPPSPVLQRKENKGTKTGDARARAKINRLLSYGATDWEITDGDARAVVRILASLKAARRRRILLAMKASNKLGRLASNITKKDKNVFVGLLHVLPTDIRAQILIRFGQGTKAVDLLLAEAPAKLDAALSRIGTRKLIQSTPKHQRHKLQTLSKRSSHPEHRVLLWEAGFIAASNKKADAARISAGKSIKKDTKREVAQERAKLIKEYRTAVRSVKSAAAKRVVRRRYLRRLQQIERRKQLELGIELAHNVRLTNKNAERTWTQTELGEIRETFERLPAAHVAGNKKLKRIHRDKVASTDPNIGGTHSDGVVTIYDRGIHGTYRATHHTSAMGEHRHGGAVGHGPLTGLEETVAHEIGHDIHDIHPKQYRKIQKLAGWEQLSKHDVYEHLMDAGYSSRVALNKMRALDRERSKNYTVRAQIPARGWVYMVDPYSSGRFLRRRKNSMPGDSSDTAPGAHGDLNPYARSNPADHFAELYSHMLHVPEQVYTDYVELPRKRLTTARNAKRAAQQQLKALTVGSGSAGDIAKAKQALKVATTSWRERLRQYHALSNQWKVMRTEIFGVDSKLVHAAYNELVAMARAKPTDARRRSALLEAKKFRAAAAKAATPKQLTALKGKWATKIRAL